MTVPVLIVDDDAYIRETVQILLVEAGYDVRCVESGEGALEILRGGFRGLLLLDVMMPGLNGWQTIDRALSEGLLGGCLISMFTAMHDPSPELDRVKEHVVSYIRKPFTLEELIESVEDNLSWLK